MCFNQNVKVMEELEECYDGHCNKHRITDYCCTKFKVLEKISSFLIYNLTFFEAIMCKSHMCISHVNFLAVYIAYVTLKFKWFLYKLIESWHLVHAAFILRLYWNGAPKCFWPKKGKKNINFNKILLFWPDRCKQTPFVDSVQ